MTAAAPTSDQLTYLLTFLEENSQLARGYLRSVEGRARSKRLWEELTRQLNALGGAHKSVKQWQKVWSDRKYLTKKAVSASNQSNARTGGGPSSASILTDTELRIVNIMGEGFGEPDTTVSVPAFPILPVQAILQPESDEVPGYDPEESQVVYRIVSEDDPLETEEASPAVDPAPAPQRRQQERQRLASQEGSFRSRLFRLEEARVAAEQLRTQELSTIGRELSVIRQSLDTLVNLLQIYMYRE